MKTLKFAGRYVARHWWQYVLGILALYVVDQVNVYVPEFTGNIIDGIERYLEAVGYDVVRYAEFNTANLQAMYDALAEGALVINRCLAGTNKTADGWIASNHDVLIHGINAEGEVLCVEPSAPNSVLGAYEALTYAMPIQNRNRAAEGTDKDWFWIVRKN